MILINLLPYREAVKKARKRNFQNSCALSALVGVVIAGIVYLFFQAQISDQEEANRILEQENASLAKKVTEVANIERENAALRARQQAVEGLQSKRGVPVELLNQLIEQVPDGLFLSSISQNAQKISLEGFAQANDDVSAFLHNIDEKMPWNTNPELIETHAVNLDLGSKQARRVYAFSLSFMLNEQDNQKKIKGAQQ